MFKTRIFFFFLMHLGFANLSKPAMKSNYFGLLLGDGAVSLLCTMAATGVFAFSSQLLWKLQEQKDWSNTSRDQSPHFIHSCLLLYSQHPCWCELSAGQEDWYFTAQSLAEGLFPSPWPTEILFKHVVLCLNSPKLQTSSEWKQLTGPLYLGIN